MTPVQVARARYDEARQIRDAWEHRIKVAQAAHDEARRTKSDEMTTRRTLNATLIQADDALEAMRVAHRIWVEVARNNKGKAA